jgi:hypothetical protein
MARPFTAARRLRSYAERHEHIKLAKLLNYYLDPNLSFWSSIENRPASAVSGRYQKLTGVRACLPDILVLYRSNTGIGVVFIELKSRAGEFTTVQREIRRELVEVGAVWQAVRSARGALFALLRLGVPFRRKWRAPQLPQWEMPASEPAQLSVPPDVAAARRAAHRRSAERARERRAAERVGAPAALSRE